MANFDELISRLHADYPEEQLRGKAFERVCKWFLTEDPYYGQVFRSMAMVLLKVNPRRTVRGGR